MYSTQGIVLKKISAGEADALFSIYTLEFGKIIAIAQGIKKEEAKLKGHLEVLNLVDIAFVLGRSGERLIQASSRSQWPGLKKDWRKISCARYLAESIDRNCFEGERDEELWSWLLQSFIELESTDGQHPPDFYKNIIKNYKTKISELLGYGGEENESVNFSVARSV